MLHSADDQVHRADPPAICASVAVQHAADQLERASIIWRDETQPNTYNNGADLQRNDRERLNWLERRRAELEGEATQRIRKAREQRQ